MPVKLVQTSWRMITKHKLYTAINVLGLALGIAAFLTLALIVRYERSYDTALPDSAQIYRIGTLYHQAGEKPDEEAESSFVPYPFLHQDFPSITHAARVMTNALPVKAEQKLTSDFVSETDADFFSIFDFPTLDGDKATALDGPNKAAIPAHLALKYFGTTRAVGRSLQIDNAHDAYIVSLVYADPPPNTSNDFGVVIRFPSEHLKLLPFRNWGSTWGNIWVTIPTPRSVPPIAARLAHYVGAHPVFLSQEDRKAFTDFMSLTLTPLRDVHFHDADIGRGGTSRELVGFLALIGVAALATALVNYINLATARAGLRAREVAMRKVLGASKRALIIQFMFEALLLVAISALVGLSLTEISLCWVNALGGWTITPDPLFCGLVCLSVILVAGGAAGAYPALVMASFRPAPVLAASKMPSGGRWAITVRNVLVVGQFTFAIILAICTLVIGQQAAFVRQLDRGLSQNGLIVIDSLSDQSLRNRQAEIVSRLGEVAGVVAATRSDMYPHHTPDGDTWRRMGAAKDFGVRWGYATPHYFDVYRIKLLAGRFFDDAHGGDYSDSPRDAAGEGNVIISRTTARGFGFADPTQAVGQAVQEMGAPKVYRVVGVIEDVRFGSPHEPAPALVYLGKSSGIDYVGASIRYAGVSEAEEMSRLRTAWAGIAPNVAFTAKSVPDIFADDYRADQDHGALFAIGSSVAILIACLGLYGLSAFNVSRRMQEIGIRKVMGAGTRDVLTLLMGQFLRPVLIANLIAWPAAWILMRGWLASFDQRIALSLLPFAEVALGAISIAAFTVLGQTLRAARQPPAMALRQA